MFGIKRRKAVKTALQLTGPVVSLFQNLYGLPRDFWHDSFVLGFIGLFSNYHATVTSGMKLSDIDKGYAVVEIFSGLTLLDGAPFAREYVALSLSDPKDEAFEMGADYAFYCVRFPHSNTPPGAEAFYLEAEEVAAKQGGGPKSNIALMHLIKRLFLEPAHKRLYGEFNRPHPATKA